MAETENIGAVSVAVVGDLSQLAEDLQRGQQMAAAAGQQMAAALNTGSEGASQLEAEIQRVAEGFRSGALAGASFEQAMSGLYAAGVKTSDVMAIADQLAKKFAEDAEKASDNTEKMGGAAGDAVGPIKQLSDAAQAVVDKQAQLNAAVENAAATWNELQAAYARGAASADDVARAEKDLTSAMKAAGQASEEAATGAGSLLKELLGFAGITIGLSALKSFAEEAIEVFASTEKATIALGYLTGSASQASETIERLKGTAVKLAIPFESLVKMQQDLTAAGGGIESIASAITAAADAAAARGVDFDKASSAIERIAETGNVSAKTLRSLALDTKDMAEAMGVSVDQVKAAFSGLDVSERLDVLAIALEKFKGAGEEVADSTAGNMQRMKVEWHLMLDDVGAAIAPFVNAVLPAISFAVKGIGTVITSLVSLVKELANVIVGAFSVIIEAAKSTGTVVVDVFTGKFGKAIDDAKSGLLNLNAVSKHTWDSMVQDAKDGAAAIDKLWAAPSGAESPTPEKPKIKLPVDDSEAVKALKAQEKAYESLQKTADVTLNEVKATYQDYIATLDMGGKSAESILSKLAADVNKAEAELPKLTGVAREATMRLIEELKSAITAEKEYADNNAIGKVAIKVAELASKYPQQIGEMTGANKTFLSSMLQLAATVPAALSKLSPADALRQALEAQQKLDDAVSKMKQSVAALKDGTAASDEQFKKTLATATALSPALESAWIDIGKVGATLKAAGIDIDGTTKKTEVMIAGLEAAFKIQTLSLPGITSLWSQYGSQISRLAAEGYAPAIKAEADYRQALIARKAPMVELMELDAQDLHSAIEAGVKRGEAVGNLVFQYESLKIKLQETRDASMQMSQSQIIALADMTMAAQAHRDAVNLLSDSYKMVQRDVVNAFHDMGKGFADVILSGKDFGSVMTGIWKEFKRQILEDIISGALKALGEAVASTIAKVLGIQVAQSTATSAIVAGNSAIIASNTAVASSYAAVAAAIHAAAAAAAELQSISISMSAAGAAGGAGGGALGAAGNVGSIVSAISDIFSNFQFHAMNKSLDLIVNHTLRIFNVLDQWHEQWFEHDGVIVSKLDLIANVAVYTGENIGRILVGLGTIYDRLGDMWGSTLDRLGDMWGTLQQIAAGEIEIAKSIDGVSDNIVTQTGVEERVAAAMAAAFGPTDRGGSSGETVGSTAKATGTSDRFAPVSGSIAESIKFVADATRGLAAIEGDVSRGIKDLALQQSLVVVGIRSLVGPDSPIAAALVDIAASQTVIANSMEAVTNGQDAFVMALDNFMGAGQEQQQPNTGTAALTSSQITANSILESLRQQGQQTQANTGAMVGLGQSSVLQLEQISDATGMMQSMLVDSTDATMQSVQALGALQKGIGAVVTVSEIANETTTKLFTAQINLADTTLKSYQKIGQAAEIAAATKTDTAAIAETSLVIASRVGDATAATQEVATVTAEVKSAADQIAVAAQEGSATDKAILVLSKTLGLTTDQVAASTADTAKTTTDINKQTADLIKIALYLGTDLDQIVAATATLDADLLAGFAGLQKSTDGWFARIIDADGMMTKDLDEILKTLQSIDASTMKLAGIFPTVEHVNQAGLPPINPLMLPPVNTPLSPLSPYAASAAPNVTGNVTINVYGANDPKQFAREVARQLPKELSGLSPLFNQSATYNGG